MPENYTGPKPALYAALLALKAQLDPWYGTASWVPDDPTDPWSSGHWDGDPLVTEQATHRRARQIAAVDRFKDGLVVMADQGDADALRIVDEMADRERWHAEPSFYSKGALPSYGEVVDSALARLMADANPPQPGDETAWCPTCQRRRVVVEVDPSCSTYSGSHELGWTATHLACGHSNQTEPRIIGRSPGGESAAEAIAQRTTQQRLARQAESEERYGL